MTAVSIHGGRWLARNTGGITTREMIFASSISSDHVAPKCRHPETIKYYTDFHHVDEELMTSSEQGGRYGMGHETGIMIRCVDISFTSTYNTVASRLIYLS